MRRSLTIACASAALAASLLVPGAHAAPPQADPTTPAPNACLWGTSAPQQIPVVNYPHGYLEGNDWAMDYPSPYGCALGPSWLPFNLNFPLNRVMVSSDEFNGFDATQHLCSGAGDPTCAAKDWKLLSAEMAMGYCSAAADFSCIEGLEVIAPDGTTQKATFLRGFPEVPAVAEYQSGGVFIPSGGSVPLWEYATPAGPQRIISIGLINSLFNSVNGSWSSRGTPGFKLILRAATIQAQPANEKPGFAERIDMGSGKMRVNPTGWNPDNRNCVAIDTGECAAESTFPSGYRYRVTIRMRDIASMYLNGALDNPVAYSEAISGGHRFTIEAGASPLLGMAGWIPKDQVPRSLIDATFQSIGGHRNWDMESGGISGQPLGRGGIEPLAWLNAFMPYFGSRASFIIDSWYVENTPTQGRYTMQCVNQAKGDFIGIVASNATAYTGDPPTYNATTSTLSYEIAGPRFMPDGTTLAKGRYSINMNADFVKCILGVAKVPSVARVELVYPDGEASAATLALRQDKNWLRLVYENFVFPDSRAFASVAQRSARADMVDNPTVNIKFPGTITCTRGKGKKAQVKQFVAFTCPKGWKLKP